MLDDEHFAHRHAIVDVPHPVFGSLKMQNVAPKLSDTPGAVLHAGPELGEHNDEIYRGLLKFGDDRIKDYTARGII